LKQKTPVERARLAAPMVVASMLLPIGAVRAAPAAHTVTIENMQFNPPTLAVKRGDRVTWVNKDLFPHTATAARAFDSRAIAPNATWTWRAGASGRHDYVCTLHPTMKATLVVE